MIIRRMAEQRTLLLSKGGAKVRKISPDDRSQRKPITRTHPVWCPVSRLWRHWVPSKIQAAIDRMYRVLLRCRWGPRHMSTRFRLVMACRRRRSGILVCTHRIPSTHRRLSTGLNHHLFVHIHIRPQLPQLTPEQTCIRTHSTRLLLRRSLGPNQPRIMKSLY